MKKSKRNSSLKFKDFNFVFKNFIKLTWNGKVLYDDLTSDDPEKNSPAVCSRIMNDYGDKLVYSMYVNVVSCHHTELFIEGEE